MLHSSLLRLWRMASMHAHVNKPSLLASWTPQVRVTAANTVADCCNINNAKTKCTLDSGEDCAPRCTQFLPCREATKGMDTWHSNVSSMLQLTSLQGNASGCIATALPAHQERATRHSLHRSMPTTSGECMHAPPGRHALQDPILLMQDVT